MEIEK